VVQPEQLSSIDGHLPRLARLINRDRKFAQRIRYLHVDEAHFIATAGQALYGVPAFRPAWGRLGELRIKLGRQVVVQALSGYESHLWDSFLYAAADADFAGPAVTLRCPAIQQ